MQDLDRKILHFINQDLSNPVFDLFFPFWTDVQKSPLFYILVIVLIGRFIYLKYKKGVLVLIACALGTMLTDAINSKILKSFFERARPTDTILRIAEQGSFSFPSGHTANAFFMATFLTLYFPRYRFWFFSLAGLTAFSRIYCGVHYPGDILGGALIGILIALLFFKLTDILMKRKVQVLSALFVVFFCPTTFSWDDPTGGKAFFPWAWEDNLKPTLKKSVDGEGVTILAVGITATLGTRVYDQKVNDFSDDGGNLWMGTKDAQQFGKLGNGVAGILITSTQLAFDQKNGVKTFQAIILTTSSHMGVAALARRHRPNNKTDFLPYPSSFPSGHTSSAFAVAGSMAYSYGLKGGIPAYFLASAIGLSRIKENRHWASDIVGGMLLGTFWARAAFEADEVDKNAFMIIPLPVYDGLMLSASKEF